MKILILTQWFEPEPTFKGLLFARELASRGHEVEVLTGFPNYPGGKCYPGYRIKPWQRETLDGIPLLRVALYPSHDTSAIRRIFNYASFAISAAILGTFLVKRPDVIYVYHPPASIGLAAITISLFRRTPFVYEVQDLWPDTLRATGMISSDAVISLVGVWCRLIYRRASQIVVQSAGFREKLLGRGVPADKIEVIYNWCDERGLVVHAPSPRLGFPNQFTVLFAGTMGLAQDLKTVLMAAKICETSVSRAQFIFIGDGVDRLNLIALAEEMKLSNVSFLPRRPMSAMGPILSGADVLLVHLKDDPLFRITVPAKTQSYLAAGKPLLVALRGEGADIVRASKAGIVCEPSNPQSLAAAVKELSELSPAKLAEMGRSGKEFYRREFAMKIGTDKFERVLAESASRAKAK